MNTSANNTENILPKLKNPVMQYSVAYLKLWSKEFFES